MNSSPGESSHLTVVLVIYFSMFFDNTLLTIVVPILPYLLTDDSFDKLTSENSFRNRSEHSRHFFYPSGDQQRTSSSSTLGTEEAALILSCKSIIQLAANPLVAAFVLKVGYLSSLFIGNIILLVASLAFATGGNFLILMIARSLHGIASVIISVSGMCICAEKFSNDDKVRSKFMGVILGSEAMGVLIGYTLGAFIYNSGGESTPFFVISFAVLGNAAFLLLNADSFSVTCTCSPFSRGTPPTQTMPLKENVTEKTSRSPAIKLTWCCALKNSCMLLIFGALFLSSSTVAVLEPCLPAWLVQNIKIEKWQSALIFLPDSFGYLISTSMFGTLPHRFGKWKTATWALLLIGISMIMIPKARSLLQLALPHFCIGLGIGTVDVVLIPMLANFADFYPNTHYSSVYALQQGASSLAYIFGSLVGGESTHIIGFSSTVQLIGVFIIMYAGAFWWCGRKNSFLEGMSKLLNDDDTDQPMELIPASSFRYYHTVFESDESD